MVTRPLVQPFYATGRQNPIAGERCHLAGCCQGPGFVHIRAWRGFKARLTINSSVWQVLPFGLQKHWALTCHGEPASESLWFWVTKESIRKQSFPASVYFSLSQFFASGGQSTGASASASVLPMNFQDWIPLGLTGRKSLQSKGLTGVFSNTTVQKHQVISTQLSLWTDSRFHLCTF